MLPGCVGHVSLSWSSLQERSHCKRMLLFAARDWLLGQHSTQLLSSVFPQVKMPWISWPSDLISVSRWRIWLTPIQQVNLSSLTTVCYIRVKRDSRLDPSSNTYFRLFTREDALNILTSQFALCFKKTGCKELFLSPPYHRMSDRRGSPHRAPLLGISVTRFLQS